MKTTKLKIESSNGKVLNAYIDFPNSQKPKQFAVIAHCFTCNSQYNAVRSIVQGLNQNGIAVARFDFTGLGQSEGEFSDSHFEANVEDFIAVYKYVSEHYQAPQLLIGHSLGGAAAIVAASQLDTVKAVATIGTPSNIIHTTKHFAEQVKDLKKGEKAEVTIGGRTFNISQEFVEGFKKHNLPEITKNLRKPILIMHAPFDQIVDISNANELFHNAIHPKSFVSLDGADHLLSNRTDSIYVGEVIGTWAKRYIDLTAKVEMNPDNHQVVGHLNLKEDNFTTSISSVDHGLIADEPIAVGGDNLGMAPYELVCSGLAACTVMTIKLYAERKDWDISEVFCYVSHSKEKVEEEYVDVFSKSLQFVGNLDEKQQERLRQIAGKCPVHKTLEREVRIETTIK